jgi:hypothetical protein
MRRWSERTWSHAVAPLRRLAMHAMIRDSPSTRVGDMAVVDLSGCDHSADRLSKLTSAIGVVREIQPWRYSQLQRYVCRVIIIPDGGQMYDFDLKACMFDVPFVDRCDVATLAGALVHETTHARLDAIGIRHRSADRPRIEQLAVRAQAHFLRAAGADDTPEATIAGTGPEWWDHDAMLRRRLQQLRGFGAPQCLLRLYRRLVGLPKTDTNA